MVYFYVEMYVERFYGVLFRLTRRTYALFLMGLTPSTVLTDVIGVTESE